MEVQLTASKPAKRSYTMWFNGITLAVAIVALVAASPLLANHPEASEVLLLIVLIGNLILRRYFTTQPLTRERQP